MRDEKTFIQLYRKIRTNELLSKDNDAFVMFINILLVCDYKTGSLETGRVAMGDMCNILPKRAYNKMKLLEKYGLIKISSNNHFTEITVVNWKKYQDASGQRVDNQQTTKVSPSDNAGLLLNVSPLDNKNESSGQTVDSNQTLYNNKELINDNISEVQELNKPDKKKKEERDILSIINRVTGRNFRVEPNGIGKTKKKFTDEEIERALRNMYKDDWHKSLMKDLKIGYLLRAETIDNFVNFEPKKKSSAFIPGQTRKTDPSTIPKDERESTPEQIERGKLIRELLSKGQRLVAVSSKTNEELQEILSSL